MVHTIASQNTVFFLSVMLPFPPQTALLANSQSIELAAGTCERTLLAESVFLIVADAP